MKYSLEITQKSDGESSIVAVDADGALCGGTLILNYSYDGADYRLEICKSAMAQIRNGDVKLYMRFVEGQTTVARLFDGQNGGEFPVCTSKLQVAFDGADCKAYCEFSYGEGGEITEITVGARVLQ